MACQQFVHLFQDGLLRLNFSSIPTFFHRFLIWIGPRDVDLHFSLMLGTKANVLEQKNK